MSWFQILGIALSGIFLLLSLYGALRRRWSPRGGILWALLWAAAAGAIAVPEASVLVARRLGITRGADLVFYCAILGALVAAFQVFARLRRLEAQITRLTRHLALSEARTPPPADGGPAQPPDATDART